MQKVQEEAETTLGMLAFDAFPRFLKSKYCNVVMDELRQMSNPNEVCGCSTLNHDFLPDRARAGFLTVAVLNL